VATSVPTAITTVTNTGLIFVSFRALLPPTGSRIEDHLVLYSGLLIGPLSITSSANSTSSSTIQHLNTLSFVAMNNSLLLILLLVMFLLLFGSRTLMRPNTSHLILQLWLNLHPISVMVICMLVMVKAFLYLILDIPCYISQNTLFPYLTFFMFLILPNHYFLLKKYFHDNNDYFEFHAFMFYVKDLTTKTVLLSG
jgi:hypothetical protein